MTTTLEEKISILEWAIGVKDKQILEFSDEVNSRGERIRVLERALLIKAKRDHLPVDVITPENRVKRWIEDAVESLKPVDAEECK